MYNIGGSTHEDAPRIMLKWGFQFANTGCIPMTYAIKKGHEEV